MALLISPLAGQLSAEEPPGFIRFSGFDHGGKIGVGGSAGMLRERAEPAQFRSMETLAPFQNSQAPDDVIEGAVDAQQLFVDDLFQALELPDSVEPIRV